MRLGVLILVATGAALNATAQNEADVQRYSNNFLMGTARHSALGGAMGALGGDFSASNINPASIAVFRFSELSITPGVESNTLDTELNNTKGNGFKSEIVLNNIGFVLANETRNPNWRGWNVGVSYTRNNTFNDELNIGVEIPYEQSLVRDFVNEARGLPLNQLSDFSAGLAWDTDVIDGPDDDLEYFGEYIPGDLLEQKHLAKRNGRTATTALAFGGNYQDYIYIGGALNIQSLFYNSEISTTERLIAPLTSNMASYTYREQLQAEGSGVNLSLGAIWKVNEILRLGGSIQTPTTFAITENYSAEVRVIRTVPAPNLDNNSRADGFFEYRIRTPWRYMASAATFIGTYGFISAQYEYSNFARGQLLETRRRGSSGDFAAVNNLIASEFAGVHTLRVGAEIRASKNLFFRGGYTRISNAIPGNDFTDAKLNRNQFSGGVGYRTAAWSVDLAYVRSMVDELYRVNNFGNLAIIENRLGLIALTASFRL